MTMNSSSSPVRGILSIILATLALLIVVYFLLFGGIPHSLLFIWIAFIVLLVLLILALITGLTGVTQGEQPGWVSRSGLILAICISVFLVFFLNWLIG